MAKVTAAYYFADGDRASVAVEIENDYPDALHEAVVTCKAALADAVALGLAFQDDDDGEEG